MKKLSFGGFTLIELLVVIAIIGILAAVVVVNLGSARKKARRAAAAVTANQIVKAAQMYIDDNPTTGDGTSLASSVLVPTYLSVAPAGPGFNFIYHSAGSTFDFTYTDAATCAITVSGSVIPAASGTTGFTGTSCI